MCFSSRHFSYGCIVFLLKKVFGEWKEVRVGWGGAITTTLPSSIIIIIASGRRGGQIFIKTTTGATTLTLVLLSLSSFLFYKSISFYYFILCKQINNKCSRGHSFLLPVALLHKYITCSVIKCNWSNSINNIWVSTLTYSRREASYLKRSKLVFSLLLVVVTTLFIGLFGGLSFQFSLPCQTLYLH